MGEGRLITDEPGWFPGETVLRDCLIKPGAHQTMWPFKKKRTDTPAVRSHGEWKGPTGTNGKGYEDLGYTPDTSLYFQAPPKKARKEPGEPRPRRYTVFTYAGTTLVDTSARAASREAGARRRAAQLQRTVAWADLEAIKAIYESSREGMHVDHIIPLRGERVSGLHVEYNLQVITAEENLIKGNSFDPDTHVHNQEN